MSRTDKKTGRQLTAGVITIAVLLLCLCITTYALVLATISVDGNLFQTGTVRINLNDGKAIIEEREFVFAPGMTVKKDFFIENQSTCEVYYRVYFNNVAGDLADILEVTITDGDKILLQGIAGELTQADIQAAEDALRVNERRVLSAYFHFPEEYGNEVQNLTLSFDVCADAVQTKNNPDRLFD